MPSESPSPYCTKRIKSFAYGELDTSSESASFISRCQVYPSDDDGSEGDQSDMDLDRSYEGPSIIPKVFPRSQSESSVTDIMKAVERSKFFNKTKYKISCNSQLKHFQSFIITSYNL